MRGHLDTGLLEKVPDEHAGRRSRTVHVTDVGKRRIALVVIDHERPLRPLEHILAVTGARDARHVDQNEDIRPRMVLAGGHEVRIALQEVIELGLLARREQRHDLVAEATQPQRKREDASEAVAIRIDVTAYGDAMRPVEQFDALRVIELHHVRFLVQVP